METQVLDWSLRAALMAVGTAVVLGTAMADDGEFLRAFWIFITRGRDSSLKDHIVTAIISLNIEYRL